MTAPPVPEDTTGPPDPVRCGATPTEQRLVGEFAGTADPSTVRTILLACHRDLAGCPAAALPELAERLARQDLIDLARGTYAPRERPTPPEGTLT